MIYYHPEISRTTRHNIRISLYTSKKNFVQEVFLLHYKLDYVPYYERIHSCTIIHMLDIAPLFTIFNIYSMTKWSLIMLIEIVNKREFFLLFFY